MRRLQDAITDDLHLLNQLLISPNHTHWHPRIPGGLDLLMDQNTERVHQVGRYNYVVCFKIFDGTSGSQQYLDANQFVRCQLGNRVIVQHRTGSLIEMELQELEGQRRKLDGIALKRIPVPTLRRTRGKGGK